MSYPQFSYTFPGIPSSLASPQLLTTGAASSATAPTSTSSSSSSRCCEGGRPIATDPTTGQSICSCQYNTATLLGYSRMAAGLGAADGVYTSAYAAQGYMPFGGDPSAFYSSINGAYDLKNNSEAWKTLAHTSPYYHYDPTTMSAYPYPNGYGGLDSARRKNATRESTNTLKAWLYEHRKNPYPTKGEKIMLAIITKMTLTQVSTWFANARRRLKKENKMTWSPRNRTGDEDADAESDGENEDNKNNEDTTKADDSKLDVGDMKKDEFDKILDGDSDGDDQGEPKRECETLSVGVNENIDCKSEDSVPTVSIAPSGDIRSLFRPVPNHLTIGDTTSLSEASPIKPKPMLGQSMTGRELGEVKQQQSQPQQKPKIWSVADVVTSDCSDRKSPRSDTEAVISHQYPSAMNDMRKWVNGNYSRTSTFPYSYTLPNFVSTGAYPIPGVASSGGQSSMGDSSRVPASTGFPSTSTLQGLYGGANKSGVGNSSSAK